MLGCDLTTGAFVMADRMSLYHLPSHVRNGPKSRTDSAMRIQWRTWRSHRTKEGYEMAYRPGKTQRIALLPRFGLHSLERNR